MASGVVYSHVITISLSRPAGGMKDMTFLRREDETYAFLSVLSLRDGIIDRKLTLELLSFLYKLKFLPPQHGHFKRHFAHHSNLRSLEILRDQIYPVLLKR